MRRGAQDVAGGQRGNAEGSSQTRRLGSFSRTRLAKEYDVPWRPRGTRDLKTRRLGRREANSALLHEAIVLAQQQVLLHLLQAYPVPHPPRSAAKFRQRRMARWPSWSTTSGAVADDREEDGARKGDSGNDLIDVLGRLRAGLHTGDKPALLLEVLSEVHRVEDDRRVEVGEEENQEAGEQVVPDAPRREQIRPGR